ncbi:hypothetical protein Pla22_30290 [Rubripirellula amarantea]|uniref:Uncharacterized protein n=1 Tax=Rubripirellula amarantea TaxID=2527999 RepID=A0A5C5WHL9_9BACT|nr:hypothetical protein [Rubripirellula amarantea]TWT50288.1 hypothetical protein Pla22_30290 [Rubripirellula amarantea]
MRLTLRTLLAYLDNTLEPRDAELLRLKLTESGFATQLVQKIRMTLVNPAITAVPPDAVGPIQDANVIGEYLDSTLPREQVAEIERACLESEVNLAEAAACHQILTMVLGEPAQVPASLRARIYELPDSEIERIAASSEQYSSLTIDDPPSGHPELESGVFHGRPPASQATDDLALSEMPTMDSPLTHARGPVVPVGPTDSGVSDAPTRLREAGVMDAESVTKFPGSSSKEGSSAKSRKDSIYGGSIRPSRITPWLVSLGLVAALLFAIVQSFSPLLSKRGDSEMAAVNSMDDIVVIETPPGETDRGTGGNVDASDDAISPGDIPVGDLMAGGTNDATIDDGEFLPPPQPAADPANNSVAMNADGSPARPLASEDLAMPMPVPEPVPAPAPGISASEVPAAEMPAPDGSASDIPEPASESPSPTTEMTEPMPSPTVDAGSPAGNLAEPMADPDAPADTGVADLPPTSDELTKPPVAAVGPAVATMHGADTIVSLLTRNGNWLRLGKNADVISEAPVVCAPNFRATMSKSATADVGDEDEPPIESEVTLVGPTGTRWLPLTPPSEAVAADEKTDYGLEVSFGRVVITSKQKKLLVPVMLGATAMEVLFDDKESIAAMSVHRVRTAGLDPFVPENFSELVNIVCVQGELTLKVNGMESRLIAGEQWIKDGQAEGEVTVIESTPTWVEAPEESPLDVKAKESLLELIAKNEPIERSLREARFFRRAEVGALASQTLLSLGYADVFFGGDGVLSDTKQRQFWPDHYRALVAAVDRGPDSAMLVRDAIAKMDAANVDSLFRMLVGFSNDQLEAGSDEELVTMLDSDSTAVRVLSLENLHEITGTTLYFRPEEPTAARRVQGLKKWSVRLQKGDIRRTP